MSNKKNWAQITEMIGIIAVVISLAFVGLELAQNTEALRSQTVQSVMMDLRTQLDFSETHARISQTLPEDRTPAEKLMRQQYFWRAMRSYENQWYQHSQGYLDEDLFKGYLQHMRLTLGLRNEGYLEVWSSRKEDFFHPGFVEFVDRFLIENPPLDDRTSRLKED